jgi:flagellar hook-length control protein FliK
MKTDALQPFFGSNEKQSGRMDSIKNHSSSGKRAGFAGSETDGTDSSRFQKVFKAVSTSNRAAERVTNETVDKKSAIPQKMDGSNDDDPASDNTNCQDFSNEFTCAVSDSPIYVSEEIANSAEQIVKEALGEIAESLGISLFNDTEAFSLSEISTTTKTQFAEIIFVLKKLLQGFEFSSKNGLSVETPQTTLEGTNIDALTDTLRSSAFKIEVACNVLGIAEPVQKEVALKLELTNMSGIVQASDPSSLVMATQHTERLFSRILVDPASSPAFMSLIDKIKTLLTDNNGDPIQLATGKTGSSASANNEVQQFSSSIYRALLKIDKLSQVGLQNESAMEKNQTLHLTESAESSMAIARNPGENTAAEDQCELLLSDTKTGMQQTSLGAQNRIPAALFKMTEESVTQQITEKLQSVIRAGLSEVRIQLRPESLGEVKMRIRMEGDVVLAKIEVQNQQVKEIMERNLTSLKEALAQQNIITGTFDIQIGGGTGRHNGETSENPWLEHEMAHGDRSRNSNEESDEPSEADEKSGTDETGKRYGNNSVEYFA